MMDFVDQSVELLTRFFLLAVGTTLLVLLVLLIVDLAQTANAVRRNYPVIGRFRRIFEVLGEFMRQYMFAMDREEMPFNRAQRNWVGRASSAGSMTVPFGSTRETRWPGTAIFANAPFGLLEEECRDTSQVTVGGEGPNPYTTNRIFHVSGMSFGAISRPAVTALGKGAAMAGCWINTGEGGLTPWHLEAGNDVVFQFGTAK
ncbi:MAG: glutamate synthase-related protein, partial [Gammaproteobacteria bacterium]|nr:glutamate synthase-related protein [Gammaproteobacteria bacterium]